MRGVLGVDLSHAEDGGTSTSAASSSVYRWPAPMAYGSGVCGLSAGIQNEAGGAASRLVGYTDSSGIGRPNTGMLALPLFGVDGTVLGNDVVDADVGTRLEVVQRWPAVTLPYRE